ncbi:MAG: right-handed parallel beta-helix repeat-containing protein, partial [Anaerolineales bacterium]
MRLRRLQNNIGRLIMVFACLLVSCSLQTYEQPDSNDSEGEYSEEVTLQQGLPKTDFNLSAVEDILCSHIVAPDGDDNQPGTESSPWASFQHAIDAIDAGDTVCFREGRYFLEDTHITKSGSEDGLITLAAYPGERPVLDGSDRANELLILDGGISHIRISGFYLENFRIWGIFLTGGNQYIILDHLEVVGGETSIRFTYGESSEGPALEGPVDNILLEDSLIWGSQYSAVDCTPGPCNHMTIRRVEVFNTGLTGDAFYGSDGIEFARGQHVLVEDCYVHDNGGDGIDLGSRDREGHSEGIIVRRNRVERNHLNGIKVWAGGRIENNSIWGQGNSAIWSGSFNCTIEIINNTVAYNMWDESYSERNWSVVVGYPEEIAKTEVALTKENNNFSFKGTPLEG